MLLAQQDSTSNAAAMALAGGIILVELVIVLAVLIVYIVATWKIVAKAGYPGAYSLLQLIPFVGFIMMLIFAFTKWPIEEEVDRLRRGPPTPAPSGPPMTT